MQKYCTQCSGAVEEISVEGKLRIVCGKCGTIFYRNPLPIAAAVVLNSERNVLLVKRKNEPRKGLWCLPIGFAEIGETIGDAAIRELNEEAGIYGSLVRLLDARSMVMDIYGDVLVVTFEIVKTGGEETAGDDAEEVGYFHPDSLPPLAFDVNVHAIHNCLKEHETEWAIQDSFHRLESDERENLLSDSLVSFIRLNAPVLTDLWFREVCSNPLTASFSMVQPVYLKNRTMTELAHFSDWLLDPQYRNDMMIFYRTLGLERSRMGFGLHEVISAMTIMRKIVLSYAHDHGIWDRAIDAYRVLELDRRIMLFYDEAIYYMARGFEDE